MYDGRSRKFLKSFGVGKNYQGYDYCSFSVTLAVELKCVIRITKDIYPEVAKKYKVSTGCVERDIRTVAEVVWRNGGREFFYKTSGELWEQRPSNARFLKILVEYIVSDEPIPTKKKANPCRQCEMVRGYQLKIQKLEEEKVLLKEAKTQLEVEKMLLEEEKMRLEEENMSLRQAVAEKSLYMRKETSSDP